METQIKVEIKTQTQVQLKKWMQVLNGCRYLLDVDTGILETQI